MKHLFAFLMLCSFAGVFAQEQIPTQRRISPILNRTVQQTSRDSLDVVIYRSQKYEKRRIPTSELNSLLACDSSIRFVDRARVPKEEFASGNLDLTLNRINLAHRNFPAINGEGLSASIKEQKFDLDDIDIKGRIFFTGVEAQTQSTHASAMASIIGGAGNSTPASKGVATAVLISSSDFATLYPDNSSVYRDNNITVQNHSYGTAIENYYGADAAAYDASVFANPVLVHVFSSGNSGTSAPEEGTYRNVQGFANVTGSFKMAKNIITVGATDSSGRVWTISSKGPSFDGRIKPEIVAYSDDGTSGAAALVSGAAIAVQHLYKSLYDTLPHSDLVRATLFNSAYSSTGKPNFESGYGSLDLDKSLHTISSQQFFRGCSNVNTENQFTIHVPADASALKVTLAWNDPQAAANSHKALLNDLDLLVRKIDGQEWLPWILNSTPDASSLSLSAVRGIDTLNNAEQISIDKPTAGAYAIIVRSKNLVQSSQAFSIAYYIDTLNQFDWSYPTAFDKLQSGNVARVRWNTNLVGSATMQYSADGGQWTQAENVQIENREAFWLVPDTVQQLKIRLVPSNSSPLPESETFAVTNAPNLQVGFRCADSVLYSWNHKQGQRYQVYYLGDKYLEPAFTTTDSFFVVKQSRYQSHHFAVAPVVAEKEGVRSYSVNYNTQGIDCYFQSFFVTLDPGNFASLEATLGSLFGVQELIIEKKVRAGFETIHSITNPRERSTVFFDEQLLNGPNTYRAVLNLFSGQRIYSSEESVYYLPGDAALVYPNPVRAAQPLRVITREPGMYTMSIIDMNGKLIKNVLLDDTMKQIDVSNMHNGLYLLRFVPTDKTGRSFTRKLIVL